MTKIGRTTHIDLDEDALAEMSKVSSDDDIVNEDNELDDDDVVDEDAGDLDKLPRRATVNADGTVTLPLLYPKIVASRKDGKVREREFKQLTFHRLTGADQRAIAAASEEMMNVVAFAQSTKISQAVMNKLFDKMDAADIADCGRVLNSFLTSGRKTGR
ncbi:hypothetical protein [Rhizobium sp. SL86]|uniref:hypothetical protein n=1 Tax=Rhizobium sp. SL86 TaxID=2995148 RepID=UPI002276E3E0|nr:hypothetical protein [Rhizobium sp. SL86]MCY1666242.1 hypothetical protein [Rhizobium sp. SL86]MCY1667851.1 hypothetical protein [Rhizobium sp. SL86]